MKAQFIVAALVALSLVSCGQKSRHEGPVNVQDALSVQSKSNGLSGYDVVLNKDSLGKPFLLQTSLIQQEEIPMFQGGRSRLVEFSKKGSVVVMKESSQGNVATKDLEQTLIIATFPIQKETGEALVFDWNVGMNRIFVAADWTGQDFDGGKFKPGYESVKVRNSYIELAEYKNNHFVLDQKVQAELVNFMGISQMVNMGVKYFLTPYSPNPNFEPVISRDFKTFGFFEVAPRLFDDGTTKIYASKWDHKKQITFAVSPNTPAEYKQAVIDGIVYWNKAFGYEAIKAVEAPAGKTAPDLDYNIVQWVTWDQAGFAFADAQMDPLNGEILHAQVYMTSVFALGGKARAKRLLDRLKAFDATQYKRIGLAGLTDGALCNLDYNAKLIKGLEALLATNPTDAAILQASQDYVREVVAHEIGHTLGLRHNFAGNLGMNFALKDRAAIFKDYLEKDVIDNNLRPSSSVMEYTVFEEAALSGRQIRNPDASAMEYDQKVIENLYLGKKFDRNEVPAFCTDSGVGGFADCRRFDTGRNLAELAQWQTKTQFDNLKYVLMERFVSAKSPAPGVPAVGVDEVRLDLQTPVGEYREGRAPLVNVLSKDGSLWSVRRNYKIIDELNAEDVERAENEQVLSDVKSLGGLGLVLEALPEDFVESQTRAFEELVDSGVYTTGTGAYGVSYAFTQEELEQVKLRGAQYIRKLHEKLVEADVALLTDLKNVPDTALAQEVLKVLEQRVTQYVFKTTKETPSLITVNNKDGVAVNLSLPKFAYDTKLRAKAAALLSDAKFEGWEVAKEAKAQKKQAWTQLLETALGGKRDQFEADKLPVEVRRWLKDADAVGAVL